MLALRPPTDVPFFLDAQEGRNYLVFLERQTEATGGILWRSLDFPGCVLPAPPEVEEKGVSDRGVKKSVKAVIRAYLEWRNTQIGQFDKGIKRILKNEASPHAFGGCALTLGLD